MRKFLILFLFLNPVLASALDCTIPKLNTRDTFLYSSVGTEQAHVRIVSRASSRTNTCWIEVQAVENPVNKYWLNMATVHKVIHVKSE